jgi:hypothetical protein
VIAPLNISVISITLTTDHELIALLKFVHPQKHSSKLVLDKMVGVSLAVNVRFGKFLNWDPPRERGMEPN